MTFFFFFFFRWNNNEVVILTFQSPKKVMYAPQTYKCTLRCHLNHPESPSLQSAICDITKYMFLRSDGLWGMIRDFLFLSQKRKGAWVAIFFTFPLIHTRKTADDTKVFVLFPSIMMRHEIHVHNFSGNWASCYQGLQRLRPIFVCPS